MQTESHIKRLAPRRLVFSGGGVRAVSYVGVLEELHKASMLKHVREFCGVSAGAFMAMLLALGYSLEQIHSLGTEFDFTCVVDVDPENLFSFFETWGLDSGEKLQALIVSILKHKGFGPHATFQDVYEKTGNSLRIWATDIQNLQCIECSPFKTPILEIRTAMYASMAFPFYFRPLPQSDGGLWMDGGILENYPMSLLTPSEQSESFGVVFVYGPNTNQKELEWMDIIRRIIMTSYKPVYKEAFKRYEHLTIKIPCLHFPELHFHASREEREEIIELARQATRSFLQTSIKPRHLIRRYSI